MKEYNRSIFMSEDNYVISRRCRIKWGHLWETFTLLWSLLTCRWVNRHSLPPKIDSKISSVYFSSAWIVFLCMLGAQWRLVLIVEGDNQALSAGAGLKCSLLWVLNTCPGDLSITYSTQVLSYQFFYINSGKKWFFFSF